MKKFAISTSFMEMERAPHLSENATTMNSPEILKTTLLDLLFENRNKLYGAYALRTQYNQRLATALCASLLFAVLVVLSISGKSENNPATFEDVIPDVIVRTQTMPAQPKLPEQPKPQQPKRAPLVAQQQYTQIRLVVNPVKATDVPAQTDLTDRTISNTTTPGNPVDAVPGNAESTSSNPVPEVKTAAAPAYTEPQFPGGAAAWRAFLSRNLQAPENLEEGEKKTVLVKFLVREDGLITGFEVVQSGGALFDAEVIRVLKKMPKWKAALRNGQPVAVPFTQPVTFIAMGE